MKGTRGDAFFRNPTFQGAIIALPVALCSEALLVGLMPEATPLGTLGRIITVTMVLFVLHRFAQMSLSRYEPRFIDALFLLLSFVGTIALIWAFRILALSVSSYPVVSRLEAIRPDTLMYLTPFAAAPLVIQAVLGMHYCLVFGIGMAAIVRLYFPTDPVLSGYVLVATLIACISLSTFRSRSAYLKAGLNVALLGVAFAFASVLLVPDPDAGDVAVRALSAIVGAALAAFLASGLTPIVEYIWGYVTDMRLLEIATLDHPLLKELSLRAPGTWNHSMVMGMMAESAADAIEANPVVARVAAYFHDIGKMTKPLYFVENQFGEENRHDKLSPSMSALIIRSHVKEGIELARQHKLPRVIEEMIPQHHGTSLIEYFYDKANKEAQEAGTEVDRNLYRYPGPKPQTREAGILMLADGIEAAARTLSEPTLDRIQGMVQKLINKVFASGELDECELTLKDLHLIAKCFTRVLHSIHHQRIAYAEPAEKIAEKPERLPEKGGEPEAVQPKELGGAGAGKKPKAEGEERGGKEGNKEDLKRLGL